MNIVRGGMAISQYNVWKEPSVAEWADQTRAGEN